MDETLPGLRSDDAPDRGRGLMPAMPAWPFVALFPADQREAALVAIADVFGEATVESIERIPKGTSGAGVFKVVANGKAYAMRIEGTPDGLRDSARQYACLRTAARVGVAPQLVYANAKHGVAIIDFIQGRRRRVGTNEEYLGATVDAIKRLHATPLFANSMNYLDHVQILMDRCQATGTLPERILERIRVSFGEITRVYPKSSKDLVSSHIDLHPGNVLFDGERGWLVDWEAAFAADCFVDLSGIANFFADNEYEREEMLQSYFRAAATENRRARLFLMRQANRLFYAMIALNFAAALQPETRVAESDLREMKFNVREGLDTIATVQDRLSLACTMLRDALNDIESPMFSDAIVAIRKASFV